MANAQAYRKGALEGMEAPKPTADQESLNGTTATPTSDHTNATNTTLKHITKGAIPGPLGAKGHSGT
jgi:hypothetical protein